MKEFQIKFPSSKTQTCFVSFGHGQNEKVARWCSRHFSSGQVVLISDENVADLYADEYVESLEARGFEPMLMTFLPGERWKNWKQLGGERGRLP